jgi:hypothetical protein
MRKSKLSLKKLYTFASYFLKRVGLNKQVKKKGRPHRVKQLDDELLKSILEECAK